ncbi:MAG: hypothetical protein LBQ06_00165, partial [Frankiaceae bacterium]|nr:hypothetical protein [Frankiaceae bacterium]
PGQATAAEVAAFRAGAARFRRLACGAGGPPAPPRWFHGYPVGAVGKVAAVAAAPLGDDPGDDREETDDQVDERHVLERAQHRVLLR